MNETTVPPNLADDNTMTSSFPDVENEPEQRPLNRKERRTLAAKVRQSTRKARVIRNERKVSRLFKAFKEQWHGSYKRLQEDNREQTNNDFVA